MFPKICLGSNFTYSYKRAHFLSMQQDIMETSKPTIKFDQDLMSDFTKKNNSSTESALDWLSGGGEIAELIRAKDWSKTPLGPMDTWSQSLRTTISLCLASNFPINIIWGPEAIQIYNSGYKVLCGGVHPRAIGESYRVTWASAWPAIGVPFEKARAGITSFLENQRMFLFRNGYLEETFFTFSLSPIRDESGTVVGLFHPVTETTSAMLNQRRTRLLRDISAETASGDDIRTVVQRIVQTIGDYKYDIPCALVVLENKEGKFEIVSQSGDAEKLSDLSKWPIDEAVAFSQPFYLSDISHRFGNISFPEYNEPLQQACLLPIKQIGRKKPIGFLVALLSTRLPFNETYMAFFDLLSSSVNSAVANAEFNEQARAKLTASNTDIHELKEQRQSLVENEKFLLSSKFAAEAATRSKSTFLANMSHEIRTPLAAILGFTEILKTSDLGEDDRSKYLNIISRNGNALVRIIDDILDLSKIEAGKIQLEYSPVCLIDLIKDVQSMFSDRAKGKGLTLKFDFSGLPSFKVDTDAVRIRQILVNLLGNAIKFTSEGGVFISGHYTEMADQRCQISLRLKDTGIGITETQAESLFQAFTQADDTTTRHYGGTGLGLALSRKLAKAMDGDISIETDFGSIGTTFLVRLNVKKSVEQVEINNDKLLAGRKTKVKQLLNWKILVVDDSEDNRVLMRYLLEREGACVEEAYNGADGIKKALTGAFDLVLMDIQMPELDGYQALAHLRRENFKKPVFALTAHSMKEERDRALAAGFTGHISKPVNPTSLVDTLVAHTRRIN